MGLHVIKNSRIHPSVHSLSLAIPSQLSSIWTVKQYLLSSWSCLQLDASSYQLAKYHHRAWKKVPVPRVWEAILITFSLGHKVTKEQPCLCILQQIGNNYTENTLMSQNHCSHLIVCNTCGKEKAGEKQGFIPLTWKSNSLVLIS